MTAKRKRPPPKAETNGWWGKITTSTQRYVVLFIALCSASGIVWSGITAADGRYAKDAKVKEAFGVAFAQNKYLENRVDVIELEGKREKLQLRLWDLERAFPGGKMPEGVLKQKITLEKELKEIDEAIDFYRQQSIKNKVQQQDDVKGDIRVQRPVNPYIQGR